LRGTMRARGYGRIGSVASMAALKGEKGAAGYAMANAALVRWTESLADEIKREGITANCVLPRIIDTPENRAAMPKADPTRWATSAEIAAAVVFLSTDEASGITGAAIPIPARTWRFRAGPASAAEQRRGPLRSAPVGS